MTNTLSILVIDDSPIHQAAAKAQLAEYNLTVVGSYAEADKLLSRGIPYYGEEDGSDGACKYDVVLADLLMPAPTMLGRSCCNSGGGLEMPIGIFLGLLAARHGAKAMVFTDSDHHSHPASLCFDAFNRPAPHESYGDRSGGETNPLQFAVGKGSLILSNCRNWVRDYTKEDLATPLEYGDNSVPTDRTVRAKNWKQALEHVLDPEGKDRPKPKKARMESC